MDSDHVGNSINNSETKSKENSSAAVNHSGDVLNGFSNGIDKKHKERDGDKHRDKHKEHRDKDRDRDRDRHKDKHSSSSKDKDRHSSSSSNKDRDKDKERRDKDKHRDEKRSDKDHKSSSSSSKDKDREHKSSSSSKHSSSSSSRDKEREKDKHSSSSSRDKEKDRHSSSDKDKHRSEKDRHSSSSKDKHSSSSSDKDKHRHSSSSDKKHSSSSSSKDKEREREKEKNREKEKVKVKPIDESPEIKKEVKIKQEDDNLDSPPPLKIDIKEENESEEEAENNGSYMEPSLNTSQSMVDYNSTAVKEEEESEDDIPLANRSIKREHESEESEDDIPLYARKKVKKEPKAKKKKRKMESEDEEEEDFKPAKKPIKKEKKVKTEQSSIVESPKKKKKKEEEEQEVWKWWEEEKKPDGVKWNFLEHKGPVFAPDYEPLPSSVKFYYKGKEMKLSQDAEEVATFYARMLEHDYTTKEAFNKNFFHDWRKEMTAHEREVITDLSACDFKKMHAYFVQKSEERKAMSKEEKKAIKEQNEELVKKYGFCLIDGHKEKIGNFRIEPPGLFRGRGEHPKMGKLKRRVVSEDIIINCSKDSKIPKAPDGHKWKEVRHDNTVTWLASWTENVQGQVKYIMLNPSSKLKGEKDWQKYETARKLAKSIDKIRADYIEDWKSKEMRIRQRAVAMYFIDKLALRAGNEKDEDQADTVGCCSLRVEHIKLLPECNGKEYVVVFDFLGKDSIRYYNEVPVEKRVFKNLQLFMENKKEGDDLFDRLNTMILNKHLNELMDGLSAKVFRTYNASWTLQNQLRELTDPNASEAEKILAYNRANRAVAILCNHQRSVPKSHETSMTKLKEKIIAKKDAIKEMERHLKDVKREAKDGSAKGRMAVDKTKKSLERLRDQLMKLEVQETDREENKTIALGTSKLNYLDPRISVAWCKKFDVPIEKIYNKTQRDKFRWAIDMAGPDYVF
ncbi:DNA topoisomerase I, mitochondrial isoform X2 [Nilaparvata lugens]|uniref:DNA topoisomerase I, mitochondrial isoform X2 n=1 Tax=Nilaparvata lugens TaxID=108931 RepID=UPI00193D8466|nr:DNA topoisomerase I, mitochondrial isoform X2 [Nilaparvata lugens]